MTKKQVLEEALKLSPQERCDLADELFESVEDESEVVIDPEIAAELDRIAKYTDEHPESLVPHERRNAHGARGAPR